MKSFWNSKFIQIRRLAIDIKSTNKQFIGKLTDYEIPIKLKVEREVELKQKLIYTSSGTWVDDLKEIKSKSISVVSNITNKPTEDFQAKIYPEDVETLENIKNVQVFSNDKSFDWCAGCQDLKAQLNDFKAESREQINGLKFLNEYPRILMALQDLNKANSREKDNSRSRIFKNKFFQLRKHRNSIAHYINDDDDNDSKIFKFLILIEKLKRMSTKSREKICSRFGDSFLEDVDYLMSLHLEQPTVSQELEQFTSDYWEGLL